MLKIKDGYAKLVGNNPYGDASKLLRSDGNVTDIYNSLDRTTNNAVLDARLGKVLNDRINDTISTLAKISAEVSSTRDCFEDLTAENINTQTLGVLYLTLSNFLSNAIPNKNVTFNLGTESLQWGLLHINKIYAYNTATFSANESANIKGIKGGFTNELIHLYNRVHIGSPNGWGSQDAPNYGLSVYGGTNLATNTGNVGISTTSPLYKLDVSGTIRATSGYIGYILSEATSRITTLNVGYTASNVTGKAKVHFDLGSSSASDRPESLDGYLTTYLWDTGPWKAQLYITEGDSALFIRGWLGYEWGTWKRVATNEEYAKLSAEVASLASKDCFEDITVLNLNSLTLGTLYLSLNNFLSSLIPNKNKVFDIGTSDLYWRNAYINSITSNAFVKVGSSDSYVLLGGGGHKTIANLGNLLRDSGSLDGRYAKLASVNNLIHSGSEITMVPDSYSGKIWFNYRTCGGTNGSITSYIFGNGAGGSLASITNGQFSGNAATSSSCTGNSATATKLATSRSLWGNSFDGSADIGGTIRCKMNTAPAIDFRGTYSSSWSSTVTHLTNGNEALLFATVNAATRFMFVNGEDSQVNTSSSRYQSLTAGLQVVNNKVLIGYGGIVSPSYELDVNGSAKVASLTIGSATITYDSENGGLKVDGGGIYSTDYVSAFGAGSGSSGSGSGGLDVTAMWAELGTTEAAKVIDISHIPTIPTSKISGLQTLTLQAGTFSASSYNPATAKTVNIPTKTSHLTNDSGFLTSHQSLAGYLPLSGGTMTGVISKAGTSVNWYQGRNTAIIKTTSYSGYNAAFSLKTTNGSWEFGVYSSDTAYLTYITDSNYNSNNNAATYQLTFPKASGIIALTSNIPTNTNQLTNGAGYITSSSDITGNAATASRLAGTNTYTAWGQTYWQNGVPKTISGNMTGVGSITASGNITTTASVGIGTASPAYKLDVSGTLRTTSKMLVGYDDTGTSNYMLYVNGSAKVASLTIGSATITYDSTNDCLKINKGLYSTSFLSAFGLGNLEMAFKIDNNGNVGLGQDANSSYKLGVTGNVNITDGTLSVTSTGGSVSITGGANISASGSISAETGSIYTSYGNIYTSNGSMAVGGAINSSYKLYVYGGAYLTGAISASSVTNRSDMRLKDIVRDSQLSIKDFANAPLFDFRWKNGVDKRTHLGTSAQYWQGKSYVVKREKDAFGSLSLDYQALGVAGAIINAREIIELRKENKMLKERLDRIEKLLERA